MISVIVPIYNVEPYLKRCLDSLVAQSLQDAEFILVDDGSTDRSGEIADGYGDPRFKVFHTKNGGLSAARNAGIDRAKGEYLMFVDSDDWVAPDFCEVPWRAAVRNGADLVVFRRWFAKNGREKTLDLHGWPVGFVDAETAVDRGKNAVWNKLFKASLFDGIRFPVAYRSNEDIATTYKLVYRAEKILFVENYLYHYEVHRDSLSHCRQPDCYISAFLAAFERMEGLEACGYPKEKARIMAVSKAISVVTVPSLFGTEGYRKAEELLEELGDGIPPGGLSWKKRAALSAWKRNKTLYRWMCRVFARHRYSE